MAASSLWHHIQRLHVIAMPQIRGGRRLGRRSGNLQGVVTEDFEASGVPGRGLPVKGKKPGEIKGAFHVSTMEVEGGDHAGGAGTATAVRAMRGADAVN